jgi:hypothetical protein
MSRSILFIKSILGFIIAIVFVSACTGGNKSGNEADKQTIPNTALVAQDTIPCDYFIEEEHGQRMIDEYIKDFRREGQAGAEPGLTKEFWVEPCVFIALDDFFNQHDTFDGVRLYWVDNQRSTIIMVPTTPVTQPSASKHTDRWNMQVTSSCDLPSPYLNIGENAARTRIDAFGKRFRKEVNQGQREPADRDSLSAAVWYSKCVIEKFADLLKTPSAKIDGVMIYSAAHLDTDPVRSDLGQHYTHQSTLILVPTKMGTGHEPNWDVLLAPSEKYPLFGAANHGQLCPQICD